MRSGAAPIALACGASLVAGAAACGLAVSGLEPDDAGVGGVMEGGAGDGGRSDARIDATLDTGNDVSSGDSPSANDADATGCTVATCAVDLALGPFHSCAILAGGGVRCWGSNEEGQLGFGAVVDGSVNPSATATPGAVTVPGSAVEVAAGGLLTPGTTPPAYGPFSCALLATGAIACWGGNVNGELGGGAEAGSDNAPHLVPAPVEIGGAIQLATGGLHACALASDAGVQCWGRDVNGQLGRVGPTIDPTPAPPNPLPAALVSQIATGGYHTCVREQTGGVECWGLDNVGQLGSPPGGGSGVDPATAPVAGVGDVVQIAAGYDDVCAVLDGGAVACWGFNADGELGRGVADTYEFTPAPIALPPGPPAVQVSVGAYHACTVRQDGSLWCWGQNGQGQLGIGTIDVDSGAVTPLGSATPVQVIRLPAVARVACGAYHTCALLRAGPVFCWGANGYGQLGGGAGDGGDGGGVDQLAHVVPVVVAL